MGAASTAFHTWSLSSKQERIDLLDAIVAGLTARQEELGETIPKGNGVSDRCSGLATGRWRDR
ncbi:hypothetical protein [Phaeobacter porticola]|uniref:hypothetical protein n=1 Tax=Phaeobacter porticola TaxID=1844006 RepID=UPI0012FF7C0A